MIMDMGCGRDKPGSGDCGRDKPGPEYVVFLGNGRHELKLGV